MDIVEEWGGDVIAVSVSALKREGMKIFLKYIIGSGDGRVKGQSQ